MFWILAWIDQCRRREAGTLMHRLTRFSAEGQAEGAGDSGDAGDGEDGGEGAGGWFLADWISWLYLPCSLLMADDLQYLFT